MRLFNQKPAITSLLDVLEDNDILTENGMPTHSTSGNPLVDYFYKMGGARTIPSEELCKLFVNAKLFNEELALKALFYNRDCRGGQGERRSFRIVFRLLCILYPELAKKTIHLVPFYGRWDDLLVAVDTPLESIAFDLILHALKEGNKLCAKWMPRDNKKYKDIAIKLRSHFGLTPKQYRKLLSGNTQVVENLMCQNRWDKINYNQVPSVAMKKYKKAFFRHDEDRFSFWIESLSKPDSKNKVHSEQLFPYDIIKDILKKSRCDLFNESFKNVTGKEAQLLDAQWKGLRDYDMSLNRMIPVCDVSGSMLADDFIPMASSIGLGLYIAERNKGIFQDAIITFSGSPKLVRFNKGNIVEKTRQAYRMDWKMNTNLEAVFRLILTKAVEYGLPEELMPRTILILSDMQFDRCISTPTDNVYQMIGRMYNAKGYTIPNVIFWNLRTSKGVPVKFNQRGTALISGHSPSIVKSLLEGELDPVKIVMTTLLSERYNRVSI
jgi:hypothetical protein